MALGEDVSLTNGTRHADAALNWAIEEMKAGRPVAIMDSAKREGETDLFFPATTLKPENLRQLRTQAGGEMYISIGHEVGEAFGLPLAGTALATEQVVERFPTVGAMSKLHTAGMCQGSCSVGLSLDHRSLHTGAPDKERAFTCSRLGELWLEVQAASPPLSPLEAGAKLGAEFHLPGHIFLCIENAAGLAKRRGHTELSVALARLAGVAPVVVGCVMLSNSGDDFGALGPEAAKAWAAANGVPFLDGEQIVAAALEKE